MLAQTVLGPVAGVDLGMTLPHEHLVMDLFRGFQPHREFLLQDEALVVEELAAFTAAGGATLVEVTTPDLGRDLPALARIARASGLHVVAGTGRYREPFYEHDLARRSTRALAEELIAELEHGVDGIRPGIIGEIGTHEAHISPAEERLHRAAARAANATGVAITTHSNASPVGLAQLDLLAEEGADLRRVAVGHCDTYPDLDHHRAILARGAYVQYDTVRGTFEHETRRQLAMVGTLVAEGHADRLLLSQDMASNRLYTAYGGRGFGFLVGEFRERLVTEAGLAPEQVDVLTVHNPRRLLTGEQD